MSENPDTAIIDPSFLPEKPWVHPDERRRRRRLPAHVRAVSALLEAIEGWHSQLASDAIDSAAAELHEAVERAERAAQKVRTLDRDRSREADRVTAAVRSGKEAPTRVDWQVEEGLRQRTWDEAYSAAQAAQGRYVATVEAEAPQRIEALRVRAERAREKARKALRRIEADVRAAADASAAVVAYGKKAKIIRHSEVSLWQTPNGAAPDSLIGHLGAVLDALDTIDRDDVLNGSFVNEPTPPVVPMVTRRAIAKRAERSQYAASQLEAIEALEAQQGQPRSTYTAASHRGDLKRVADDIASGRLPKL